MREIKTRRLRNKEIIIDAVAEEKEEVPVSKQKPNDMATIIFLVIILSLVSGSLGAFFTKMTFKPTTITTGGITTSTAPLSESNSIANAVQEVYDSTVVVEVYAKGTLYSTGTGFVYKKINRKINFYFPNN